MAMPWRWKQIVLIVVGGLLLVMRIAAATAVCSDDNSFFNETDNSCVTCDWTHYPSSLTSDGGNMSCVPYVSLDDPLGGDRGKSINAGNTAWVVVGTALVMLMTPALAFFYGGLASEGNVMHTMMLSIVSMAAISIIWVVLGYSLTFGPGSAFIGGVTWVGLNKITELPSAVYGDHVPHLIFCAFQCMFAAITPALISGAIVGRMKFSAYCIFIVAWSLIVYCPLARWVWSMKIDSATGLPVPRGWLAALPVLDAAGGCAIHTASGFAALAASLIVGARTVRTEVKADITRVLIGATLLQFGWFGFNAASALSAGKIAVYAFMNTHIATCAAVVVWLVCERLYRGQCSFMGACTAVIIGLVAITPGCFFVSLMSAIGVGGITALVVYVFNIWKARYFGEYLDDTLDVFSCHGLSGFLGTTLVGLFADEAVGGYKGAVNGHWLQLGHQLAGATVSAGYSFGVSVVLLLALRFTIGVRVSEEAEALGLDNGEEAHSNASKAPRDEDAPVAFIFTDIEKSTKLWSRSHALMSRLMDIHNKVIRSVIDKYDLYEVKTVGDSFVIASGCPVRALQCAFDIQTALFESKWDAPEVDTLYKKWIAAEALNGGKHSGATSMCSDGASQISATTVEVAAEPTEGGGAGGGGTASAVGRAGGDLWNGLRVRIGLHFGECEAVFDSTTRRYDYRGAAVAVAARVEAAAHGGQIMVTQSMWQEAKARDPTLAEKAAVMQMGACKLRGFREPFTLLQVMPLPLASRRFAPARLGTIVEKTSTQHAYSAVTHSLSPHHRGSFMSLSADRTPVTIGGGPGGGLHTSATAVSASGLAFSDHEKYDAVVHIGSADNEENNNDEEEAGDVEMLNRFRSAKSKKKAL